MVLLRFRGSRVPPKTLRLGSLSTPAVTLHSMVKGLGPHANSW